MSREERLRIACACMIELRQADALVAIGHPEMRGALFEIGAAYAYGMPIVWIGDRNVSLFSELAEVRVEAPAPAPFKPTSPRFSVDSDGANGVIEWHVMEQVALRQRDVVAGPFEHEEQAKDEAARRNGEPVPPRFLVGRRQTLSGERWRVIDRWDGLPVAGMFDTQKDAAVVAARHEAEASS